MLPIIDIARFRKGGLEARRAIARDIGAGCETIGFLYAENHGVPRATIDDALCAARRFFARPGRDKRQVERPRGRYRGYIPLSHFAEGSKGGAPILYEAFLQGLALDVDDPAVEATGGVLSPNLWPKGKGGSELRRAAEAYWAAVTALSGDLLRAFALALGLPEGELLRHFKTPLSNISYLHYPKRPGRVDADGAADLRAHTDTNALTILLPDPAGGLEVRLADGSWHEVEPLDGCFVVNIGNMMARWSGGRFRSTLHRVNPPPGIDRYSIGYFAVPDYDTVVRPLVEPPSADAPPPLEPLHVGRDLAGFIASCDAMTEVKPG